MSDESVGLTMDSVLDWANGYSQPAECLTLEHFILAMEALRERAPEPPTIIMSPLNGAMLAWSYDPRTQHGTTDWSAIRAGGGNHPTVTAWLDGVRAHRRRRERRRAQRRRIQRRGYR